ncbi:DoxX family protein [Gordonia sp. DT30]|uniref:DoxX family protein n=1 Tax=unclassified Gordonia (in: high G+C Gram-positive bacteria) TaxID=2657482 RepID=UPI003CE703FA
MLKRFSPTQVARALAAMLLTMGTLHFLVPKPFDQLIPDEVVPDALPDGKRTLTYASGVAEVAIGAGLLAPATRRPAAGAAAALFVAVYPANINMVRLWWRRPAIYKAIAIGRLPLQFPLIAAAVKVYRHS